jgi:hypothetical protein
MYCVQKNMRNARPFRKSREDMRPATGRRRKFDCHLRHFLPRGELLVIVVLVYGLELSSCILPVPGKAVVCEVVAIRLPFIKKEGSIEFTVNFGDSTSSISFHVSVMGGNVSGCPRRLQRGGGCPSTSSAPRGRSRRRPGDTRLSSKATGPQSVGCCQGPTLDCPPSEAPDKPQLSVVFSSSSPDT